MNEEEKEKTKDDAESPAEEIADTNADEANDSDQEKESKTESESQKLLTQEEFNEKMENRVLRERKRLEREYKEQLSKYQELAYLAQEGLKASDLDETLTKSREFYGKQGIKYVPNNTDDEIVGKYYANEIISEAETLADLEEQANRLSRKKVLSARDEVVLKTINDEISDRKRISELKTIGVTEEEYASKEFNDFEKLFTKETPIKEIYKLFKLKNNTEKSVDNPGSMKSVAHKSTKGYISEEEYNRMTRDQIRENFDVITESMSKW